MEYDATAVRRLRKKRRVPVSELAAAIGMSDRGIRFLEAGTVPSARLIGRLAAALGVPLTSFFIVPEQGRRSRRRRKGERA